jgi:hypothetical protein
MILKLCLNGPAEKGHHPEWGRPCAPGFFAAGVQSGKWEPPVTLLLPAPDKLRDKTKN